MKAAGGPQKLRFTIHSSSGEVRMHPLLVGWGVPGAACDTLCATVDPGHRLPSQGALVP
jgi:hypothetical protein